MVDDYKLLLEATFDGQSADVTAVLFRDRPPLPVGTSARTFTFEGLEEREFEWELVKDVLVELIEHL